jgi:hypothetical protein
METRGFSMHYNRSSGLSLALFVSEPAGSGFELLNKIEAFDNNEIEFFSVGYENSRRTRGFKDG